MGFADSIAPLVSDASQYADLMLVSGEDGPARGARFLIGRTLSGLHFRIAVDRGLDIVDLDYKGVPLGWRSPTGMVAPGLHAQDGEGGLAFLRGFTGFLVTCGWDHYGPARQGPAGHRHYALRDRQDYPLHGRANQIPAQLRHYGVEAGPDGDPVIRIVGVMRQFALFAEGYEIEREIVIEVARPRVTLHDRVRNIGRHASPHRVLYHINLAYPLVDDGTAVEGVPAEPLMPSPMPPLDPAEVERFKCIPHTDCAGTIIVRQAGPDGVALAITLSPAFTHLVQWWNRFPGANMIGIEPASAAMPGLASDGDWQPDAWMAAGEVKDYRLQFDVSGG